SRNRRRKCRRAAGRTEGAVAASLVRGAIVLNVPVEQLRGRGERRRPVGIHLQATGRGGRVAQTREEVDGAARTRAPDDTDLWVIARQTRRGQGRWIDAAGQRRQRAARPIDGGR